MQKFISNEILEEIQSSLSIVDVIDEYVKLKKIGKNFKALCPFHIEKTPSFIVSEDKQIYHCFGCGEGGNMFNFTMKHLNMKFPEAAEFLANKVGIKIPEKQSFKKDSLFDKIYQVNKIATSYYHQLLGRSQKTNDYIKNRGFKKDIVDKFLIGYATADWEGLRNFAKRKGFSDKLLQEAGLVLPGKKGGYYDRFRNRVIFPIFDINSRIVGFGGRVLDKSTPKYINSPETKVYNKSKHLYGLNFTKSFIREKDYVIVLEGYTDVLSLYQVGIKNVVANLGTALTHQHIRELKRFSDNIIVVYDSDEAGRLASLRNLDLLIENDMRVKLVCLPHGKDPDSYIQEFGSSNFLKLVNNAKDLINYKLDILSYRADDIDIHKKKQIVEDILISIGKINDHILKSEYLKQLSGLTNIDEEVLRKHLQSLYKDHRAEFSDSFNMYDRNFVNEKDASPTERLLLRAMLESSGALELAKEKVNPEDLKDPAIKEIVKAVFSLYSKDNIVALDKLMRYVGHESYNKLLAGIFCEFENMPENVKVLNDCISSIELKKLNVQLSELKKRLEKANQEEKKELLFSYDSLHKEITCLKNTKYKY